MKQVITVRTYHSPYGEMLLGDFSGSLCLCDWLEAKHRNAVDYRLCHALKARYQEGTSPVIESAMAQLEEYWHTRRTSFDVPLLKIGTDFQQRVWEELLTIPYGDTVTYADIACAVGRPNAVRAVANAVGGNPLSVLIPCHRVVGANHKFTGYAGGVEAKMNLLRLEQALRSDNGLF